MEKKIYAKPSIKVKDIDADSLLQASNELKVPSSDEVDTNPNDWAESKKNTNVWTEE